MKYVFTLLFISVSLYSFSQITVRYTVLPAKKGEQEVPLTQKDLKLIDSLFFAAVSQYNNGLLSSEKAWSIKQPSLYYRQYVPYFTNGQRLVWVNCFCSDPKYHPYRKKEQVVVNHGGTCFFNFLINLSQESHSEFRANGVG